MSFTALAAAAALTLATTAAAHAAASQPPLDISKLDYAPVGQFKPGDPIPATSAPPKPDANGIYNPSGKYNAYDTNVYESLNYPARQAGDKSDKDPVGNGGMPYGFCPPSADIALLPSGQCDNHQLEYLDHYERTMKELLGDFGVVIHRYKFESPGSGTLPITSGNPGDTHTPPGTSYNIAAVVPGADDPDESVLVSGHYDFTDGGPAAAWDSSEGHAEVIRMAKIMSDYWRATGTRPSATVKFIPWDGEEAGTLGSIDYVENNVPPGEEHKIRGYFNVDPCAGAYPAFRNGSAALPRIPLQMQLADPAVAPNAASATRFKTFNDRSGKIVDEWFERVDDTMQAAEGAQPVFVTPREAAAGEGPSDRANVVTTIGGLLLFSSDYRNFEAIGVPFFNLSPDLFGPHADGTPASAEGVAILHTPRDNLTTINALTSSDITGLQASEGWMKGMEMCAGLESWYMLQPEMGGAQTADSNPVAYFEALPNEALAGQKVGFDAGGSYRWASAGSRTYVPASELAYEWEFGDGKTGSGRTVEHQYAEVGKYTAKLTVRNTKSGKTDTMSVPITVIGSSFTAPVLKRPAAAEDEDGTFELSYDYAGTRAGQEGFLIEQADDFAVLRTDDAEGQLDAQWTAERPARSEIAPWQRSDSSTGNVLGNRAHGGRTSFWAGQPVDQISVAGSVISGDAIMTSKEPVVVPARGNATLDYWSLFRNEGDDSGRVEVAIDDGNPATPLDWDPVDEVKAVATALGDEDEHICDATNPLGALGAVFEHRSVDLSPYRNRRLLVRFVMRYGAENRAASQPCGWYVDDIRVASGTFEPLGTSKGLTFTVTGRSAGSYGYRVKALFNDGVTTAASNVETVRVTRGVPRPAGAQACVAGTGVLTARVAPTRGGVRYSFGRGSGAGPVDVVVRRMTSGRRVLRRGTVVRRFRRRSSSFSDTTRRLAPGTYVATFTARVGGRSDARRVAFRVSGRRGRPRALRDFARPASCGLLRSFALTRPVFGGSGRGRSLSIGYTLGSRGRATLAVVRGKRTVKRFKARTVAAGKRVGATLRVGGLKPGAYRVKLTVKAGKQTVRATLTARKL